MPIAFSCSKFSSISQRSSALHLSFVTSLCPYFVPSSSCSTTTTGTSPTPTVDSSLVPLPRRTYPARKDPAAAPSPVPSFHTSVADSVSPTPPHCEFPAVRNPATSPGQLKSAPRVPVSSQP